MVVISYLNIADWPQNCQLWCGNISVSPFCGVCSKSIEFLEFLKLFEHTPKKIKIGDFPQILGYGYP